MPNEDGSVWVVFNGEIYNHAELRRELEALGHGYRTHCDTETLVHGWEQWGEDLFGRLNGIFAFAAADVRRREIVLVEGLTSFDMRRSLTSSVRRSRRTRPPAPPQSQ